MLNGLWLPKTSGVYIRKKLGKSIASLWITCSNGIVLPKVNISRWNHVGIIDSRARKGRGELRWARDLFPFSRHLRCSKTLDSYSRQLLLWRSPSFRNRQIGAYQDLGAGHPVFQFFSSIPISSAAAVLAGFIVRRPILGSACSYAISFPKSHSRVCLKSMKSVNRLTLPRSHGHQQQRDASHFFFSSIAFQLEAIFRTHKLYRIEWHYVSSTCLT